MNKDNTLDSTLEKVLTTIRLRAKRRIAWLRKLWSEEGSSGGGLAVTHEEIDTHVDDLDSPDAEAYWFQTEEKLYKLNEEIAAMEAEIVSDKKSRFAQLHQIFGLSAEDSDLLQTCLAVSLDPTLARVYAYLHDHAGRGYATEHLAARLLGHGRKSLWNPESPLRRWNILVEKETAPGEPNQLICDNHIRDWLQGRNNLDEWLVGITQPCSPHKPLKNWPLIEHTKFIKSTINGANSKPVRFRIVGQPGSGRRTMAALLSSTLDRDLYAINSDQIEEHNWNRIFAHAQRYAHLNHSALAWYGENVIHRIWPQISQLITLQFIICEPGQVPLPLPGVIDRLVEVPSLSIAERGELWKRLVPKSTRWSKNKLNKLITQHQVEIGDIISVCEAHVTSAGEAIQIVREKNRHRLGNLAQLLESPFKLKDLIVPKRLKDALEDLIYEAKERTAFWEKENAKRLFPQGKGLVALLSGPPGCGKTMAAQAIAEELEIDLFRVDVSSVVSKYVGMTSRHLKQILSLSTGMDIVILFDEAEALFSKRTEVKDAHDRFANTDTSYLLQAIENYNYRGIVILATNKKANIDQAFIRRLRYVLEFSKPDIKLREKIWEKILNDLIEADQQKITKKELKAIAEGIELTGAQIKYAILSATFLAKREKKKMELSQLLQGINRELMKEGQFLSRFERETLIKNGS
jgi:replication-associated recombination protein RarA